MKWLYEHDYVWSDSLILDASKAGNVEMMRWVVDTIKIKVTNLCHHYAAKSVSIFGNSLLLLDFFGGALLSASSS